MINKIAVLVLGLGFMFYRIQLYFTVREEKAQLHSWLKEHDLLDYEAKLHKFGKLNLCIMSQLSIKWCTTILYRLSIISFHYALSLCTPIDFSEILSLFSKS